MSALAGAWFDSHCHLQERYVAADRAGEAPDGAAAPDGAGSGGTPGDGPAVGAGPGPASGRDGEGSEAVVAVLRRAAAAGVGSLVCVGTDPGTSTQALALAAAARAGELGPGLPRIWATVGLHPHEAAAGTEPVARLLAGGSSAGAGGESAGRASAGAVAGGAVGGAGGTGPGSVLVAVGECGLDYHYDHSPREAQRAAFAEQVALAHRYGLALVIHAREAWDDLFDVLAAEGVPERTVLHCFTGGPDEARRCLDTGMFLSFSGIVTFKTAGEVREAAALCPLDRLLVETDSPFLAPVPHRGQPNEPAFVPLVGRAVAEARGVDPSELAEATSRNAAAAFGL